MNKFRSVYGSLFAAFTPADVDMNKLGALTTHDLGTAICKNRPLSYTHAYWQSRCRGTSTSTRLAGLEIAVIDTVFFATFATATPQLAVLPTWPRSNNWAVNNRPIAVPMTDFNRGILPTHLITPLGYVWSEYRQIVLAAQTNTQKVLGNYPT
jgi:hypothetical protein